MLTLFKESFGNAEMIRLYWNVGNYLSELCAASKFGDKVIDEVASFIAVQAPNIKGFSRRGLYRMKQFYETYKDDEFVSPLVTQISWSNHLLIMSGSKSIEEGHFYLALCAKERYSKRELERQMDSAYYSPAVDDELDLNMSQQADLDWLMYNKPLEYAQLILSGEIMDYFKYSPMHGLED